MIKLIILAVIVISSILLFFIIWGLIYDVSDSIKEYSSENSDDEKSGFLDKNFEMDSSENEKDDGAE
jgi:regulatory protein YycH of two-component signal transduction system YycFG